MLQSVQLLMIGFAVSALCFSQAEGGDSQRITLGDAVRLALENNHELKRAQIEVVRADAQVTEAWGTALPKVNLNARYTRALMKPVFFLPDFLNPGSGKVQAIEIGSTHAFDMTFSAEQVLFNSAVLAGVGAARTYARGARELFRSKELETITVARKAYYQVLLAREVYGMMRQNLQYAEENAVNVRRLASQGLVSEYDELRSQVALANLRPEVIKAENGNRLALNGLKVALGIPYEIEIEAADTLSYRPVSEETIPYATQAVLKGNPSLAALRLQIEVNDAIISAERSGFLPTVSAFGNYQLVSQNNQFRFSTQDFFSSSQVGLSLSFNIFNGFQTSARVDQAQLEMRKSQEQTAMMETTLQVSVESILLQLRRAQERIASQGRAVEQAERGYRIATTRYNNGSGTQLEVNDARLALSVAKVNRMEAMFDYLVATADLDQALGRLPDFVETNKKAE